MDQGPTVFGRTSACDVEESLKTDTQFPLTRAVFIILFYLETDLTHEMHKKITDEKRAHTTGRENKPISCTVIWKLSEIDATVSTKHTQQ